MLSLGFLDRVHHREEAAARAGLPSAPGETWESSLEFPASSKTGTENSRVLLPIQKTQLDSAGDGVSQIPGCAALHGRDTDPPAPPKGRA